MADENALKCDCVSLRKGETASNNSDSNFASECCMKQRLWWLLRTGTLSDVTFVVGSEPHAQPIRAHKIILMAGSSVFKTMFSKNWSSSKSNDIRVPDVEPAIFSAILRFVYTDSVILTADSVIQILYAAKKYAVLALEDQCIDFLEKQLCPENAFTLLAQARLFDEPKLVESCLAVIDKKAKDALSTDYFTTIDLAELCLVLKRDTLRIREVDLFEVVLRWASAECERKNLELNAENQKSILEDALYLVRYPLMTQQEFIAKVVPSSLLTSDELVNMWLFFSGSPKDSFSFNSTPRTPIEPLVVKRFQSISGSEWSYLNDYFDSISFSFNRDVKLCGFGLYGPFSGGSATYQIDMDVKRHNASDVILRKNALTCQTDGSSKTYRILLKEDSIALEANEKYTVIFNIQGPSSFRGENGMKAVYVKGSTSNEQLTVHFYTNDTISEESGSYSIGQIPELLIEW